MLSPGIARRRCAASTMASVNGRPVRCTDRAFYAITLLSIQGNLRGKPAMPLRFQVPAPRLRGGEGGRARTGGRDFLAVWVWAATAIQPRSAASVQTPEAAPRGNEACAGDG